jgi:chromate transporter
VTHAGTPPRSIVALMAGLARLGIIAFGGVGPQAHHTFVERSGWLDDDEFAELYSIAQALPGANVVNLCGICGDRWFGPAGAAAAVAAITVPPLVLVLVAASLLAHVPRSPRLVGAECALVAASAGLILATAYRVFATIARRRAAAYAIAAAVAASVALHVLSMPAATVAGLAAGIAVAWRRRTRA